MRSIERKARGFLYRPTGERIAPRSSPAGVIKQEWRLKRQRRLMLIELLKEESKHGGSISKLYAGLLLNVLLKEESRRQYQRKRMAELTARTAHLRTKWKRRAPV
jgi:hypothetical protein